LVHAWGGFLMPRIPILPGDVSAASVAADPFGSLPPAQADGIRALEARDEGITRGLTVAEAWRDSVTVLQEAESAEDGAPAGFARDFFANADRGRSTALRSAPPGQRGALDNDLQGLRADLGERAVTAEAAGLGLRRRLGLMQTLDTYAGGVTEDPGLFDSADGQINTLVETLGLPENRASALRTEMRTRLANAAVDGLMADPAEAEAALRLGLYDDVLPKEIKQQRLAEAETQMQRARLLDGERRRQALSRRAAEGAADDTEIAAAQADGSLSETDAARLRAQTVQAQQTAETRRARIDRVAGGEPLDPGNEEDRQAADVYWEDVSEAYAFEDPAQQRQAELDLVRRIGVLPDGLSKKYRGMLLSRDPEIVVEGARAVDGVIGSGSIQRGLPPTPTPGPLFVPAIVRGEELRGPLEADKTIEQLLVPDRAPDDPFDFMQSFNTIPDEDRRRAALITEFANLGLPADRAVELADEKMSAEDSTASAALADDAVVDNDQTDAPFVGGEDEGEGDPAPLAANDDEIVENDQTATPFVGSADSEGDSLGGIQEDGSAVVVDPETGEEQPVGRETVERAQSLADRHKSVAGLQREFLDLFDQVEAGEITQQDATGRALSRIREALPATNALGSTIDEGASTRRILERLATDLFDAEDRAAAGELFFDSLAADPEAVAEVAELVLGFVPGIGEVISAKDAYEGFLAAVAAAEDGRTGDALIAGGIAGVSAAGAIPILGKAVKLGEGAMKVAIAAGQVVRNRAGLKLSGIPDGKGLRPAAKDGTISGASRNEAWAVDKVAPGVGEGAGEVHRVTNSGKSVYASEETTLIITPKEPVAAEVLQTGRPLGLADDKTFQEFKSILKEEKTNFPDDVTFAVRGSAVNGNGFNKSTGKYDKDFFDVGRKSDHDLAVMSRELLRKAQETGVVVRDSGTRTAPLSERQIEKLGLLPTIEKIRELTGRNDTTIVIYRSNESLNRRGANIKFE
jgi:hypothetical protein